MGDDVKRAFRLDRAVLSRSGDAVDEELAFHLREAAEELIEEGWSGEDARREALRRFGDLEGTRTYCADMQAGREREVRRSRVTDELRQDLTYAARTLRRTPGYAALVVATLAFGIAANTTIFSAMNPYLVRELPYGKPDELVHVNQVNPITGWDMDRFSWPQYQDWKSRSRAFSDVGAYSYGVANVTGPEGPEQVQFARMTANLLGVLGVEPTLGRGFTPEEGSAGGPAVVLLSHRLWQRRYDADPGVVGRTLALDGVQHTVVGVMPSPFNFPYGGIRLWVPIQESAAAERGGGNYQLVGRLEDGWTRERARVELAAIQAELAGEYPEADGRMAGVTVKPLREALNFAWEIITISFTIMLGAVAFVLLIACVNVASLTVARAGTRAREIAVRAALGARRGRLVRQLLTEGVLLAAAGGVLGVALAYWAVGIIAPVLPEDLYRVGDMEIDGTVLAFSAAVTLATPVAFALLPALRAAGTDLTAGLKEAGRTSAGAGALGGRRALVVAQVALAVVLTTGAGLMTRSFAGVREMDLGMDVDRIVFAEAVLPAGAYASADERLAYVDRVLAELRRTPGVSAASAAAWLPLNHEMSTRQVAPTRMAGVAGEEWPLAVFNYAHPGYFETMGIERVQGRDFERADGPDAAAVAVVNRSLARRFWPAGDAVGQTLLAGDPDDSTTLTVVGVVADARHADLTFEDTGLQLYRPTLQGAPRRVFMVARTQGRPADLVPAVRRALLAVDPDLPPNVRPMTDLLRENQLQWSVSSLLLSVFGAGALLLATLGIYGLVSYAVAQRRRELGVRMALGATRADLRRVVVGDGVRLAALGTAVGIAAAVALARLVASVLYGVSPFDPFTLGGVAVLFLGVAALASLVPAERASRADPVGALRAE